MGPHHVIECHITRLLQAEKVTRLGD
jgi:hypothetical protein